jgi:ubiquitin-protein ligase E3 C
MFVPTPNEGRIFPNPASGVITSSHLDVFEFMGRLLGKALYESTLVEPRFAAFFLNKLLGRPNYVDDLRSLDVDLHRQLLSITQLPDVSDLALTFSFLEDRFGVQHVVELAPGGAKIDVDNANRHRYIAAMAFHYLHTRIAAQSRAFRRGLNKMVPVRWIRMFSQSELQHLIGGASDSFDIEDMKRHCKYGSGYHLSQPYIQGFWEVVASFTPAQRAKLLRFTTSCSRPPLLGFKKLYPPFCVQKLTIQSDADRLPIAATCYNLLKLPLYSSVDVMREKLLLAIEEGAEGFGLS